MDANTNHLKNAIHTSITLPVEGFEGTALVVSMTVNMFCGLFGNLTLCLKLAATRAQTATALGTICPQFSLKLFMLMCRPKQSVHARQYLANQVQVNHGFTTHAKCVIYDSMI